MRGLLTILVGASALASIPAQAQMMLPQQVCGTRAEVTTKLEATFGEFQKGAGMVSEQRVLELWESKETGSWTLLMTQTDGQTCIIAAGNHWRERESGSPT